MQVPLQLLSLPKKRAHYQPTLLYTFEWLLVATAELYIPCEMFPVCLFSALTVEGEG